eukprot:GEMP01028872.1.p2 GENE.GEMP01028872.1~~GEMP01028872.1.p2  ORF type:complete len:150 (-),score=24.77 GEMP01028872.1:1825-2211(-)
MQQQQLDQLEQQQDYAGFSQEYSRSSQQVAGFSQEYGAAGFGLQPIGLTLPTIQFQPLQFGAGLQNFENTDAIPSTPFVFYATSVDDAQNEEIPAQPERNEMYVMSQPKTRDVQQMQRKTRRSKGRCC